MAATPANTSALRVEWLGTVPYGAALERQREAVEERRRGGPDRLLLLEHPAVITLGRSAKPENLRASRAELARRGVVRELLILPAVAIRDNHGAARARRGTPGRGRAGSWRS